MSTLTLPDYTDETAALADFDERAERSECFRLYREVEGFIMQPRLGVEKLGVRIDRILVPEPKLQAAGWPHGPFGVEAKRSEEKAGKAVAQALDYSRATYALKHGWWICLEWIFLWPFPEGNSLGSVMAQNRIGSAIPKGEIGLAFKVNGINGIRIGADGAVSARELPMGWKAGNRGG